MKLSTLFLCLGLIVSCSKDDIPFSNCYHNEYIIDDLGSMVSTYDFDGFGKYLCQKGTILILADDQVIYERMTEVMGDFEMEIDFFPDEFEIRFLSDPYFLNIEVVVDADLRRTEIVEKSNLCGGIGDHG